MCMKHRRPYHFVAEAYPVHNGKALLVKVGKLGAWLPPGGHLECSVSDGIPHYVETPEEAAIREVKEETGLDIEIVGGRCRYRLEDVEQVPLPEILNLHNIDEEHDHLGFEYFCMVVGDDRRPKPSEEGPCRWFSIKELSNLSCYEGVKIPSNVRTMAIEAIKSVGSIDLDKHRF